MTPTGPMVVVQNVHKHFKLGNYDVHALKGLSLEVMPSAFLAISGSSGSGKTTLLNLIGCIDRPSEGRIFLENVDVSRMPELECARLRADKIGYIFQTFNLLPVLTATENVEYPLLLQKVPPRDRVFRTRLALEKVGLAPFAHHRPDQLSGGQRQRVAIARALVKLPSLILADEPTANLDGATAEDILRLMAELNASEKITFIFSSHDPQVLRRAKQVVHLQDGRIES
jgi:putative ABC transport system ATP-binding protein